MSVLHYNIYFYFKWLIHFWRAKRKLRFIKSLIHAFQTRINNLSFYLHSSFSSVIMEQQLSDLLLLMWAADCILWLADICLDGKSSPVHCGVLWSRILASGSVWESEKRQNIFSTSFFGHNYKSSRHIHFMRLIKCFKQAP